MLSGKASKLSATAKVLLKLQYQIEHLKLTKFERSTLEETITSLAIAIARSEASILLQKIEKQSEPEKEEEEKDDET